jgi:chemotaxis protein MotA
MDKASVSGSLLMFGVVALVCYQATHGDLMSLWSSKGFYMVILGSIAAVLMAMPMDRIKMVPGYVKKFMFNKARPTIETIALMSTLAEKARRDGILALESEVAKIDDPFLASGLKMAVDGVDPDTIEATMRFEIMAMQDRHKSGKKFFDLIKTYGPGLGLVATLMGQIGMFKSLGGDIATMGYMLAVAVVATMYGTDSTPMRLKRAVLFLMASARSSGTPLDAAVPPAPASREASWMLMASAGFAADISAAPCGVLLALMKATGTQTNLTFLCSGSDCCQR